jgi:hypothetical protein
MKNFHLNIIFRFFLLTAMIGLCMYLLVIGDLTALMILTGVIIIIQISELIRYVNITNEEVKNFLEAVQYSDFSMHSRLHKLGGSFRTLSTQINKVMEQFQNTNGDPAHRCRTDYI